MPPLNAIHPRAPILAWRDRYLALRDRLLSATSFQRVAFSFPFTRYIAKRRSAALFDLVAGFVYSQILVAATRLRIFDLLAQGPWELEKLALELDLEKDALHRLLLAMAALDLVETRSNARFGLGRLGAPMVGNTALASMIEHHHALYADLADPVALLRKRGAATELSRYWTYSPSAEPGALAAESVASYSELMSASLPLVSEEILFAYDIGTHRRLLDVGGGEGRFACRVATLFPKMEVMLFDLPAVAERARLTVGAAGLAQRVRVFGGDFFTQPLPQGADAVSLIRVLHDHDDEAALKILRAVRDALPVRGTLLLAEPMAQTSGARRMGDAYFGMYLLCMGRGRPRTNTEITRLLQLAGFGYVQQVPTRIALQTQLLCATAVQQKEISVK